ncbi:uncharacterized protein PGRI_027180 [Penicillium griseofulvum]|uniref:C2H2-type domain-containing protein n=1 Tax=Penicillium patulum TaxID=5078 RepID=A0A135LIT1_PENPA|nr:uncharacterized protein PGRI_027180 [Penicillium griseofulvum]KXG48848.1 hypothetical protein PGRI_027180 [Penicillium griseofulvum]
MTVTEEVPEATALDCAINDASDQTVRAVLKTICAKNDEARKEAESQLLVIATDTKENSDNSKRLVSRYTFCINCEKEFDVTTNTEKACRYHPKENEPTGEELYVDNWEFEVDNDEMREDFPHCFTFKCCGETLKDNPHGCETDFHREQYPDGKPSKRSRVL